MAQKMIIGRRTLLGIGAVGALGGAALFAGGRPSQARPGKFEVQYSDAEWRNRLTPQQYEVLRHEKTERPRSSPLNNEKRKGLYACAGCGLPVFSSVTKYESGTGWPSFWRPLPQSIGTKEDDTLFEKRIEVHCRRCGGHLGHVFKDGPRPTGLRYCLNGAALVFRPA